MRLQDISLLDPTTKLTLSGSLDYPTLNGNPPLQESKNVRFIAGKSYCPLASLQIEANLKVKSGDIAHASRQNVQRRGCNYNRANKT